jgi:hypothetical protein
MVWGKSMYKVLRCTGAISCHIYNMGMADGKTDYYNQIMNKDISRLWWK